MSYRPEIVNKSLQLYEELTSAEAVADAIQKEFKGELRYPEPRTIRRWRNQQRLEMHYQHFEEHYQHLADIAALVLEGLERVTENQARGNEFDVFKYTIIQNDLGWGATKQQLASGLQANIEDARDHCSDEEWISLWNHISAEFPEIESRGLYIFANEKPYELIVGLQRRARDKKFKGTCPACRDQT